MIYLNIDRLYKPNATCRVAQIGHSQDYTDFETSQQQSVACVTQDQNYLSRTATQSNLPSAADYILELQSCSILLLLKSTLIALRHLHYPHQRLAVKMSYIEIQPTFSHLNPNSSMVERFTGDQKAVGSSPAWELRYKNSSKNITITIKKYSIICCQ